VCSSDLPAGIDSATPRAGSVRRKLNRANGLMTVLQAYARGSSSQRAPIEMIVTTSVEALRSATEAAPPESTSAAAAAPLASSSLISAPHDRGASIPVTAISGTSTYLAPDAARRLACDSGLVEATVGAGGEPLSIGRKTRTIPAAIKRALYLRDRTCRFPGCDHRLFLDGHHLQHWADGGETRLENLALLCSTHHHYVHERGYRITCDERDGALTFLDPRGKPVRAVPPRPAPSDLGWPAIHRANAPLEMPSHLALPPNRRLDVCEAVGRLCRVQNHADKLAAAAPSSAAPSSAAPSSVASSSAAPSSAARSRHLARPSRRAAAARSSPRSASSPLDTCTPVSVSWSSSVPSVPSASSAPSASPASPTSLGAVSFEKRDPDECLFADPDYDYVYAGRRTDDLLEWALEEI
jgi:hypothetical protein